MAVDILTAAVGEGETLPGGCWDFDGNATNGAYWASASNAAIPDLSTRSYAILTYFRYGGANNSAGIWYAYKDTNNRFGLRRFSDNKYYFQQIIGGAATFSLSVNESVFSCCTPMLCWRNGSEAGMATYVGGGASSLSIVKATGTISSGDTFDASIKQQAAARMYIGHLDGTTAASKFAGSIGPVIFAICGEGETLADYGLTTDTQRLGLMLDAQRFCSAHGFTAAQMVAYGNWADSSGVAKTALINSQFAANDRNVCPFSGNYLSISSAAHASQLACPPYTMPAHPTPMQSGIGEVNYLGAPQVIENPNGGWIATRIQPDESGNPSRFIEFLSSAGVVNRWPVFVPYAYIHVDSSASNAKAYAYNNLANKSGFGDTHSTSTLILTDAGLLVAPFGHSDIVSNAPASGDTTFSWAQYWLLTDEALPELIEPYTTGLWGTAYSTQDGYTHGTKTYSLMNHISAQGRVLECWRSQSSQASEINITEFNTSTKGVRTQLVIEGGGTNCRNYPGPGIVMSDGLLCSTNYVTHNASNNTIAYTAFLVPLAADFTDNTKWYAFDGTPLDGSGSNPTLGTSTYTSTGATAFFMTDDNAASFPSVPASAVGLDALRMECPIHITGGWEGLAAIVRRGEGNADAILDGSDYSTNSSGGRSQPFAETTIRRWTYNSSTPGFTFRDSFDITSIIATLNPGNWPQDTNYTTAVIQFLTAMQVGTNKMLLFINDPENVAISTNLSHIPGVLGFTLKGALFHKMNASDPTQYVELVDIIYQIATDNTEGYGLFPYPAGNGTDGQHSVMLSIAGGMWNTSYGNRNIRAVDLRTNLAASTPASGPQLIGGQLVGFPIVGQQIVGNKLVY